MVGHSTWCRRQQNWVLLGWCVIVDAVVPKKTGVGLVYLTCIPLSCAANSAVPVTDLFVFVNLLALPLVVAVASLVGPVCSARALCPTQPSPCSRRCVCQRWLSVCDPLWCVGSWLVAGAGRGALHLLTIRRSCSGQVLQTWCVRMW